MGIGSFLGGLVKTVLPSVVGGAFSAIGAKRQNEESEEAAQKQMDFQERMSNTQYQRAMDDMRKAGLNPLLAYKQGGAGTPGGSTYSPVNVGSAGVTGAAQSASSAVATRRVGLEERLNKAQLGNIHEDTNKKFSEQRLNQASRNNLEQDIRNKKITAKMLLQAYEIQKTDVTSAKAAQKLYGSEAGDFFKWWQMLKRR